MRLPVGRRVYVCPARGCREGGPRRKLCSKHKRLMVPVRELAPRAFKEAKGR